MDNPKFIIDKKCNIQCNIHGFLINIKKGGETSEIKGREAHSL